MNTFNIPKNVKTIIEQLNNNKYKAYIVGGCVRDIIIGKTPNDWDICTSAKPTDIIRIFEKTIPTGLKHGTVTVVIDNEQYEVTTFRIDGEYSDGRRPDQVKFTDDITKDLSRRDFTMNAIAFDVIKNKFIDPFNGIDDIKNGIIKCVGNPIDRFNEDRLRIFRAIRFSCQLGFMISDSVEDTIYYNFRDNNSFDSISNERICSELTKIMESNYAFKIFDYPFVLCNIIPEFKKCLNYNQNNPYHVYNLYEHLQESVKFCCTDSISKNKNVKLALMFHDIGKPECRSVDTKDSKIAHYYGHAKVSAKITRDILTRLRFDNKTINDVCDLIYYHDSDISMTESCVKRWLNKLGVEQFFNLLSVKYCDIYAQNPKYFDKREEELFEIECIAHRILEEQTCFSLKDLAINGKDLIAIGIPEGKEIGDILNNILNKVINGDFNNNKEELLNIIKFRRNEIYDK